MNLFSKMWFAFFDEEFIQTKPKAQPPEKPQQNDDNNEQYDEYMLVDEPDEFDWAELVDDDCFDEDIDIDAELGLDLFE